MGESPTRPGYFHAQPLVEVPHDGLPALPSHQRTVPCMDGLHLAVSGRERGVALGDVMQVLAFPDLQVSGQVKRAIATDTP